MIKRFDNRYVLDKGERPPYPVIISNPKISDVVGNLNRADFGIVLFFAAVGKIKMFIIFINYIKIIYNIYVIAKHRSIL